QIARTRYGTNSLAAGDADMGLPVGPQVLSNSAPATDQGKPMRAISLAEANKMIEGTFASAKKRKAYALAAIVLDAGGRVKAFQKQDGASLMRFEIAYGKAFASLALNRSSRQVLQKAREKPAFMQSLSRLSDGPLFLEAGGQLVRDRSGEIVGA